MFKGCLEWYDGPYQYNLVSFQRDEAHFSEPAYFEDLAEEGEVASVCLVAWEDLEGQGPRPGNSAFTSTRHPTVQEI